MHESETVLCRKERIESRQAASFDKAEALSQCPLCAGRQAGRQAGDSRERPEGAQFAPHLNRHPRIAQDPILDCRLSNQAVSDAHAGRSRFGLLIRRTFTWNTLLIQALSFRHLRVLKER